MAIFYNVHELDIRHVQYWNCYFCDFQVNSRIKALKRQLDETEEEVTREKAARRKIQRELEDLIADNESKEREITNLKNKLR